MVKKQLIPLLFLTLMCFSTISAINGVAAITDAEHGIPLEYSVKEGDMFMYKQTTDMNAISTENDVDTITNHSEAVYSVMNITESEYNAVDEEYSLKYDLYTNNTKNINEKEIVIGDFDLDTHVVKVIDTNYSSLADFDLMLFLYPKQTNFETLFTLETEEYFNLKFNSILLTVLFLLSTASPANTPIFQDDAWDDMDFAYAGSRNKMEIIHTIDLHTPTAEIIDVLSEVDATVTYTIEKMSSGVVKLFSMIASYEFIQTNTTSDDVIFTANGEYEMLNILLVPKDYTVLIYVLVAVGVIAIVIILGRPAYKCFGNRGGSFLCPSKIAKA